LILEEHVSVKWGNTLLSSGTCHDDTWRVVNCTQDAVHTRDNYDRTIMVYAHDEYCVMLLTPSTCNRRAGTSARVYALSYPGRLHRDVNVFRRLAQHLCETRSVTPTAPLNAGRPRTVRTPANEDNIIAGVEIESWRSSRDIPRELRRPNQGPLKYFMSTNCIHTTTSARG
jgi:hypothetical protein